MLEGVEWIGQREWERAIFLQPDRTKAQLMHAQLFPPKAIEMTVTPPEEVAKEVARHKERMRRRREKEATA